MKNGAYMEEQIVIAQKELEERVAYARSIETEIEQSMADYQRRREERKQHLDGMITKAILAHKLTQIEAQRLEVDKRINKLEQAKIKLQKQMVAQSIADDLVEKEANELLERLGNDVNMDANQVMSTIIPYYCI